MKTEQDKEVKTYFEIKAKEFDDIYDDTGGVINRVANKVFRKGMRDRFNLTLQFCSGNKSVLDVGCGAGRFCIPLAERGMQVTGIDYSKKMIRMANEFLKNYCKKTGKQRHIDYACCDFMTNFNPKDNFDISLAIGVFDYLKEPLPFLRKMKQVTKESIIASFPKKFTPQMPIRKIWLAMRKCPVYFYTKQQIRKLYAQAGLKNCKIIDIPAGYFVKANAK